MFDIKTDFQETFWMISFHPMNFSFLSYLVASIILKTNSGSSFPGQSSNRFRNVFSRSSHNAPLSLQDYR
jgi:hypothetical protein